MRDNEFNIGLTNQELSEVLKHLLTGPNKDLLAEAISELIDTSWKRAQLVKAVLGIKPESIHALHEKYLINEYEVGSYNMNKPKMVEEKMIDKDGKIECTLIKFSPFEHQQYTITFDYIHTDSEEVRVKKEQVSGHSLTLAEEFPEGLNDDDN